MEIDYFTPFHVVYGAGATIVLTELIRRISKRDYKSAVGYAAAVVFAVGAAKEANDMLGIAYSGGTPDAADVGLNTLGIYGGALFENVKNGGTLS